MLKDTSRFHKSAVPIAFLQGRNNDPPGGGGMDKTYVVTIFCNDKPYMVYTFSPAVGFEEKQIAAGDFFNMNRLGLICDHV